MGEQGERYWLSSYRTPRWQERCKEKTTFEIFFYLPVLESFQSGEGDLGLLLAVEIHLGAEEADLGGQQGDVLRGLRPGHLKKNKTQLISKTTYIFTFREFFYFGPDHVFFRIRIRFQQMPLFPDPDTDRNSNMQIQATIISPKRLKNIR